MRFQSGLCGGPPDVFFRPPPHSAPPLGAEGVCRRRLLPPPARGEGRGGGQKKNPQAVKIPPRGTSRPPTPVTFSAKAAQLRMTMHTPPDTPSDTPDDPPGLDRLAEQVRREVEIFAHSAQPWVPPAADLDGRPVLDVLIVGGGLYGMGLAWGLMRARVTNIAVVDKAPRGREGIWVTSARMRTLRTPKELTGIEFGIPSLSVRAYWEAKFGRKAWADLERIPRVEYFRYLEWFRAVCGLPVQNDTEVVAIDGDADLVRVTVRRDGRDEILLTRRLVLATGLLGSGGPNVPADLVAGLPAGCWAHSSDIIDFARWQGGEVGVLGAGASAFDAAIRALEAGAAGATLFCRRPELPWRSAKSGLENAGFMRHFADFPDRARWRFIRTIVETPIAPPRHTVERALALPGFRLRLGEPWRAARPEDGRVTVATPLGPHRFDAIVFGTGFAMDIDRRPELAALAPHALRWRDRFTPPDGEENAMLLGQPWLGGDLAFQEREAGACPVLGRVAMLGAAAMLSVGPLFGGLNGLKFLLDRMVDELCRALILESLDAFDARYRAAVAAQVKPSGLHGSIE